MIARALFVVLSLSITCAYAEIDVVKADIGESLIDKRASFKETVLRQALEITEPSYGEYELRTRKQFMNAKRAFSELTVGDTINTYFALTNPKWEKLSHPIKIPLRCGVSSYRLLVVDKRRLPSFEKVKTLEQLKGLKAGLNDGWTTYSIMNEEAFKIIKVGSYDSMFSMLLAGRFDYLVRSVYEVYDEIESRKEKLQNLTIAPNIALHIPSATYLFVSKNSPRIAKRLHAGIKQMQETGALDELCEEHFKPNMERADLASRIIFEVAPSFPVKHFDYLEQKIKHHPGK